MRPSGQTLDRNLSGLLRRSYRPVRPSVEFTRRLERALSPWIEDGGAPLPAWSPAHSGAARPRRLLAVALAAAAAFLVWLGIFFQGAGPGGDSSRAGLRELLADGAVAVRFWRDGEWERAGAAELELAVRGGSGYAELATPAGRGIALSGAGGWSIGLRSDAHLRVEERDELLFFSFLSGGARLESSGELREVEAPLVLCWSGGGFHDPDEARSAASPGESGGGGRQVVEFAGGGDEETGSEIEGVDEPPASGLASLVGVVRGGEGAHAIAGFEVTGLKAAAPPQVALPITRSFLEPGGSFRWDGLEPGRYSFFIQAEGYAIWKSTDVELRAGEEHTIEATFEEGGVLRGFVVDRESGAAIEGALVVSERDLPAQVISMTTEEFFPAARAFTITAADGSFELPRMSAGGHRLRAGGTGFGCEWLDTPPVVIGEVTDGLLFELEPGGAVVGRVVRPDGSPWSGARVVASRYSGSGDMSTMSYQAAVTDETGAYQARDLAPGFYVVLFFGDGGLDESEFEPEFVPVEVRREKTSRIDFPLRSDGASLSGVIRDAEGRAMPRANVYLFTDAKGSPWVADTTADDGSYSFEGIEAGSHRLYAGVGHSTVLVDAISLEDGQRATRDGVLDGHSLEIRVNDAGTGAPLAGVTLLLLSRSAGLAGGLPDLSSLKAKTWLGVDGVYLVENLPVGDYLVLATTEDGAHADTVLENVHVAAEGGDPGVTLSLERAGQLTLWVRDAAGAPIEGVSVELYHPHGHRWPYVSRDSTGADGSLAESHLEPGRWTAILRNPGCVERTVILEVSAEQRTEESFVLVAE